MFDIKPQLTQEQKRIGPQKTQTIIVTDLICEGPIEGLVEGRASVFLDNDRMDTPAGGTKIYSNSDISSVSIQLTEGSNTGVLTNASLEQAPDGKRYLIIKKTHTQTVTGSYRRAGGAGGQSTGLKINTSSNFFEDSMVTIPEEATSPATIVWARLIPLNDDAKELAGDTQYYSGRIGNKVSDTEAHWYPIDTGMAPFSQLQWRGGTYTYTLEIDTPVEVTNISGATVTLASNVSFGAADTATSYSFDDAGEVFDKVADLPDTGQKVHSGQLQFRVGELHQKALTGEGGEGVNAIVSSPNAQIERSSSHLGVNYGGSQAPKVFVGTGASGTGFGLTPAQVSELDEIKINISYGGGFKQVNSAGDDEYTYQDYKMFISFKVNGAFGTDTLVKDLAHSGMYNDPVTWEHIVDMEQYKPFDDFRVTIVRKTADDGDGYLGKFNDNGTRKRYHNNINQTQSVISNLVSIIKDSLSFPLTAMARVSYSTKSYQELPERRYHIRGLRVSVPSNYVTREEYGQALYTRSGDNIGSTYQDWDGTFRTQVYTNNPAWVFYDILINNRYGLGTFLSANEIDKYALYRIARYCDELVPNGKGGTEPRYTCNVYIGKQTDAYKLLKDLTTNFVAMLYFLDGKVTPVQDVPASPTYTFNATNVINGEFNYESTGDKTQTNQIVVTWNNPENMYVTEPLILEDRRNIAETGRIISRSAFAFGCTSEGQATRYGRWKLWTSINQKEIVSFQTGMTAAFLSPGDLVNVQDAARHGLRYGGRISSTGNRTATEVPLDSAVAIISGSTYDLNVVFVKPGAYLIGKESVTINSIVYNSGDLITEAYIYNTSNSAYQIKDIETEEEAANAKATASATDALLLEWKDTYRTESRRVTTSAGANITSLTVSEAFSTVPLSEDVWGLKETSNTEQVVHGSLKVYKVLGISEDSKGNFDITAAEHYNEKFQSIDTDFNAYIADRIYPILTHQTVVPPVICLYSRLPKYKENKSVTVSWIPPADTEVKTSSVTGQEVDKSLSSIYAHLMDYEIRHNLPESTEYHASPIPVERDQYSYEFKNVPVGTFTVSIRTRNKIGVFSERKDLSILIEDKQADIVDGLMEAVPKGGMANSQTTISSTDRGHLTVTNFSAAVSARTQGIYSGVAGTSDGSGTVGTFNIQVSSSGAVTSAVAATFGSGHTVGDTITIADSVLGGGGAANFTMDVNTVSVAGVFSFAGPSYNYKSPQQVASIHSNPSNGAAATFSQDCTTMTTSTADGGVDSGFQGLVFTHQHYYILFDRSNADKLKLIKYKTQNGVPYWYDAGTGNGTGLETKSGTLTRVLKSATIVGASTSFLADFQQGSLIKVGTFSAKVTQVVSNTKMLIDRAAGPAFAGVTYQTNNCRIDYNNDSVLGKVYKDSSGNYHLDSYVSYDTSSVLSALTVSGSTTDSEGNIVVTMSDNSQIIIPKGVNVKVVYADDASGTNKSFTRGSNQRFVLYFEYTGPTPALSDVTGTWVNYIGELQGVIAVYATSAGGAGKTFNPANGKFVNFLEWTGTKPLIGDSRVTNLSTFVDYVGSDGVTINVDTPAYTVSTTSAGVALANAFVASSTKITVSVGSQDCTSASSGAFTFSVSISARTAVTDNNTITLTDNNKTVNIPVIATLTAASGSRTFQITVRNADGAQIGVYNKIQTFSQSLTGAGGDDGEDGTSTVQAELSNANHTVTASNDGTVASGGFAGTGTQLKVFEGSTALDFNSNGSAAGTFAVSVAVTNVTAGSTTVGGSAPARFASFANISAMSADTGKIVFTITGKKADGTSFTAFNIQQSFSKSKTGAEGDDGDDGDDGADGDGGYSVVLADPAVTIREQADGTYDFSSTATNLKVFHQGTSIYSTSMVSFVNSGTTNSTLLITARTITGSIPNNINAHFVVQQDALGSANGGAGTANADQNSGGANPFFIGWNPITSWTAGGLKGTRTMTVRARSIVGGVTTDSNFTVIQTITAIPYQPRSAATFTFNIDSTFLASQGNGAYSVTNANYVSSAYAAIWAGTLTPVVARGIVALVQNNSSDKCIVPGDVVEIVDTTTSTPNIAIRIYRPTVNPPGTGHFGPASNHNSTAVPNFQSIPTSVNPTSLWSSVVVKRFEGSVIVDGTLDASTLQANTTITQNLTLSGKIVQGKTTFGNATAAGFFLGMESSVAKFRIGNSDNTRSLSWNGENLTIKGDLKGGATTSSDGAGGAGFFLGENGSGFIGNPEGGHIKVDPSSSGTGATISAVSKEAVSGIGSELILFGVQGAGSSGSLVGSSPKEITIGTIPLGENAFKPFASVNISVFSPAACRVKAELLMTPDGGTSSASTISFTSVTAVSSPFGFLGNLGVVANVASYNLMSPGDTITAASASVIATVGSKYTYNNLFYVWLNALSGNPAGRTSWQTEAFNANEITVCTKTITVPSSSQQSLTLSGFLNQTTVVDTAIKLKLTHSGPTSATASAFPTGSTYTNLYAYGEKVK